MRIVFSSVLLPKHTLLTGMCIRYCDVWSRTWETHTIWEEAMEKTCPFFSLIQPSDDFSLRSNPPSFLLPTPPIHNPPSLLLLLTSHHHLSTEVCKVDATGAHRLGNQKREDNDLESNEKDVSKKAFKLKAILINNYFEHKWTKHSNEKIHGDKIDKKARLISMLLTGDSFQT